MKRDKMISTVGVLKFIKNVVSWTIFCILLIIALLLVYYVLANYRFNKKGKGYEPIFSLYTIISPSMEPKIKVYDLIVDVPVKNPSTIEKGDIITFVSTSSISEGMTVTHRVVGIDKVGDEYFFTTKGDNNATEDSSKVHQNNVLGKVKFKIPAVGRLQFFLASKGGWVIVILIPAIVILVLDIIKLIRMLKTKKQVEEIEDTTTPNPELKSKLEEKKEELKVRYQEIDPDDIEVELPKLKD